MNRPNLRPKRSSPDHDGRRLAVDALYGEPLPGCEVIEVPADLAPLFALAHHRIRRRPAGVHAGDGTVVDHVGEPVGAADDGAVPDRWMPPPADLADRLSSARAPVVVAGPGVVLDDAVPGLHALAASASLGVLNTWGAKGVFDWRSRHHLATAGLQALDFELSGVTAADLVLAVGIDEAETAPGWRSGAVVDVHPWALAPLAEQADRPRGEIGIPALRSELARVTQAGWEVAAGPLPPTRVTRHYGQLFGGGGLVAADPGMSGYWVARTLPTTGLGGALVPSTASAEGFSIAAAIVARLVDPARRSLAVTDRLGDVHHRLAEVAERLGVAVALEVWDPDGPVLDAAEHLSRLDTMATAGGTHALATDQRQLDEMVEVAGPIVAWRGDHEIEMQEV